MKKEDVELEGGYSYRDVKTEFSYEVELLNFKTEDLRELGERGGGVCWMGNVGGNKMCLTVPNI